VCALHCAEAMLPCTDRKTPLLCAEAVAARARGTSAFARGAYADAAERYGTALRMSAASDAAPLFANRAAALLRLGHAAAALRDCERALQLDPVRSDGRVLARNRQLTALNRRDTRRRC